MSKRYQRGEDRERTIAAQTAVAKALEDKRKRRQAPPTEKPQYKPMGTEAQLERGIHLASKALNKYEVKLDDGEELTPEEERVFMSLLDSIRKLEVSLQAIKAKQGNEDLTPAEIAFELIETGMAIDDVKKLYADNPKVLKAIKKEYQ